MSGLLLLDIRLPGAEIIIRNSLSSYLTYFINVVMVSIVLGNISVSHFHAVPESSPRAHSYASVYEGMRGRCDKPVLIIDQTWSALHTITMWCS